ncbi:MAG: diacylglycerol kinase family protein [Chloroflexota bacterium]
MLKFLIGRGPAFKNAFNGLKHVLLSQHNARIHLLATILVVILGILLELQKIDWAFITIAIGLVWISEIFNTSLEALVDLTTNQYHPLARIAKDTGAAAVLVASFISLILGLMIFLPRILNWLAQHNLFGLQEII